MELPIYFIDMRINKKIVLYVIIAALSIFVAISLFEIITYSVDVESSEKDYKYLSNRYVMNSNNNSDKIRVNRKTKSLPEVDFESLQGINSDIKAWIRFDDLKMVPIDYPVVYNGDNDKYLHTDIYGNESRSGSLFMESSGKPEFSDPNEMVQIIYGHNMRNGSMFGSLRKYSNSGFYNKNKFFNILTSDKKYRYRIFSCFKVSADSSLYQTNFTTGSREYGDYLEKVADMTIYKEKFIPSVNQHIVILSTCIAHDDGNRFVVCAVQTYESNRF